MMRRRKRRFPTSSLTDPSSAWSETSVTDLLTERQPSAIASFRKQPLANKLTALENAVVPAKKTDTPSKIVELIQALLAIGAINPEEAGSIYSDLLIRVHKFNGTNVQENLNTLTSDIRAAQSEAIRNTNVRALSNQAIVNELFSRLPPVPSGQQNFEAFKQTLRLFCNEAPNVTLYKSGGDVIMQVNIRGVNTINLDSAFGNLQPLWGIDIDGENVPQSYLSSLSSNARVLMLMLAPFTNDSTFTPDSLIALLFKVYRDTVSASLERPEETEMEVAKVSRETGTDGLDLQNTLGFLLKQREREVANPYSLTPRQEQVLRFIQKSLVDRIDRGGMDPVQALDTLHLAFAPSFYDQHHNFIRRLTAYMLIALQSSPEYFREVYSNKYWIPPRSFWTRDYSDFFNDVRNAMQSDSESFDSEGDFEWDDNDFERMVEGEDGRHIDGASSVGTPMHSSYPSTVDLSKHKRFSTSNVPLNVQHMPQTPSVERALSGLRMPPINYPNLPSPEPPSTYSKKFTEAARRDKLLKETIRQNLRQINEASNALEAIGEEEDDYVLEPLLGYGSSKSTSSRPPPVQSTSQNPFAHLAPKRGFGVQT